MIGLNAFTARCLDALTRLEDARQAGDPDAIELAEKALADAMRRRVGDESEDQKADGLPV